MAEAWSAREAGAGLLAAVTRAISEEQMRARAAGRLLRNSDLARAVLASPALQDANQKMLDAMMTEYEPKVAALVAAEAGELIGAVLGPHLPAIRDALSAAVADARYEAQAKPYRAALEALEAAKTQDRSDEKEAAQP